MGGLTALMQGDGTLLRELLIWGGLALGSWPLLVPLFALPATPTDRAALLEGAVGLALVTTILPLLIAGGALGLAVLRRPPWWPVRGRAAGMLALLAYGGAGYGILTTLAGMALLTLLIHYSGLHVPGLPMLLQGFTLLGVVGIGSVFAGQFMAVYATARRLAPGAPAPPLAGGDLLVGGAAALVGLMEAVLLGIGYDLLLDWGIGLGVVASALLLLVLGHLRRR